MASFELASGAPDVLIVRGNELSSRKKVRDYLYGLSGLNAAPVGDGTHDFWITYFNPSRGGPPRHSYGDMSRSPRPLRGIIYIPGVSTKTDARALRGAMYTLTHEVGHHWLVSPSLKVDGLEPYTSGSFTVRVNSGEVSFPRPPMVGRGGSHWSPYWQSDDSAMDGTFYDRSSSGVRIPNEMLARWDSRRRISHSVQLAGGPLVETPVTYSDLELNMMGIKNAADCYPSTGGRFFWIEPRIVGPLEFRSGLFVAFATGSVPARLVQFGFDTHYNRLVVADGDTVLASIDLDADYDPFLLPRSGVMLRIVRRGTTYEFHARYDLRDQTGCGRLIRAFQPGRQAGEDQPLPSLFDDLNSPATSGPWSQFRLVASADFPREPDAVGLFLRRWNTAAIHTSYEPVQMQDANGSSIMSWNPAPYPSRGGWLSAAHYGSLRPHLPATGPKVWRDDRGRYHLLTPYGESVGGTFLSYSDRDGPQFDYGENDGSPKLYAAEPEGDFAIATSGRVELTAIVPWAGGSANGKYIIGSEHGIPISDYSLRPGFVDKQTPPPGNAYKIAHIIVTTDDDPITQEMIDAVDLRRRYFDELFFELTEGKRELDSSL